MVRYEVTTDVPEPTQLITRLPHYLPSLRTILAGWPRSYNMASFDDNRDTLAAELFSMKPQATRTIDRTPSKEGLRQKCIKLERLRKQELARCTELHNLEDKTNICTHRPYKNLNPNELRALHKLSTCTDIVIREADKGGNVVIMDRTDYIAEIDRQLNDTQAYSALKGNPLPDITSRIEMKLTAWKNLCLLTDSEYKYLYTETPRAPCIYILPKVHKPGGFPPGRPIISGIGSPTEHISEYIDSFLQPLVHNLPSYIQDTRDLLCQLEDIEWTEDCMFICLDVSSLYTSIPLEKGLEMLQLTLSSRDATLYEHTQMLLDLTRLVLENNVFLHDGRWFRQCQGVAMGATFSPSYANLYMGQFEKNHLWSNCPTHITEHILYWGRYIDDFLGIWTGNITDLNQLIEHLNKNDFNLVFTHKVDTTQIEFLDLLLYITNNTIMSRLYRKPTACNSILHAQSAHPLTQIRAIPYGEMVRIRRNCTDTDVFRQELKNLTERFQARDYTNKLISAASKRISNKNQHTLLLKKPKEPGRTIWLHLMTTGTP
ncbi:hypothetical protein NDU88_003563 [Pleurodeles waltl]|uniref:Reverse transcriptase domain-containing protein n=1 Tax=Pleurodeles waltl TaxID=8319 RepID=A0AAV7UGN5_PLEWA|nr:hypothetical protein NDU88_003563 [Pleurodeles waltl]